MREPRTRHGQYVWTTSKLHGWPAFDVNDITLIEDEAAALAATPSGGPLDVERLADALHPRGKGPQADCCFGGLYRDKFPDDPDEAWRQDHAKHLREAANVAAEYARLTEDAGTATPSGGPLREALENLLDDTQHAEHDCNDTDCPVSRARAALAATPSGGETEQGRAWRERHAYHHHEKYGCPFEGRDVREWAEVVDGWRVRAIEAEAALAAR